MDRQIFGLRRELSRAAETLPALWNLLLSLPNPRSLIPTFLKKFHAFGHAPFICVRIDPGEH
jgi:hypothetical protein